MVNINLEYNRISATDVDYGKWGVPTGSDDTLSQPTVDTDNLKGGVNGIYGMTAINPIAVRADTVTIDYKRMIPNVQYHIKRGKRNYLLVINDVGALTIYELAK